VQDVTAQKRQTATLNLVFFPLLSFIVTRSMCSSFKGLLNVCTSVCLCASRSTQRKRQQYLPQTHFPVSMDTISREISMSDEKGSAGGREKARQTEWGMRWRTCSSYLNTKGISPSFARHVISCLHWLMKTYGMFVSVYMCVCEER